MCGIKDNLLSNKRPRNFASVTTGMDYRIWWDEDLNVADVSDKNERIEFLFLKFETIFCCPIFYIV